MEENANPTGKIQSNISCCDRAALFARAGAKKNALLPGRWSNIQFSR